MSTGLTLQRNICFSNSITVRAFLTQYRAKLAAMMDEYAVRLVWDCDKIVVYSKTELSKLFISEILQMKRSFVCQWFVSR